MSIWSTVASLFGEYRAYGVVWREQSDGGATMRGKPIWGKSDTDAISLVRAEFMHAGTDWTFWVLFRPDDTVVSAERGPKFAKWVGDFAHVGSDSHVLHTLESLRRHHKAVSRPLHKVKLKTRGQSDEPEQE